jgi:hypothetical protein
MDLSSFWSTASAIFIVANIIIVFLLWVFIYYFTGGSSLSTHSKEQN